MNFFHSAANLIPAFHKLANPGSLLSGLSRVHKAHFAAVLAMGEENSVAPLLILVETESQAARMCADINALAQREIAAVFPGRDPIVQEADARSSEYEHRRIAVLTQLSTVNCQLSIVIATPEAAAQETFAPADLREKLLTLKKGDELDTEKLLTDLIQRGYSRTDLVESPSQFSVRGSVIDVFPVNLPLPVRLDLWGDEIESIALFDAVSQRRGGKIEQVVIAPAHEEQGCATLYEFVQHVIICEHCDHLASEHAVPEEQIYARFDTFSRSATSVNVSAVKKSAWNGDYKLLREELSELLKNGYAVVMFGGSERAARGLASDLRDDGLPADYASKAPRKISLKHIYVIPGAISAGFDYPEAKCACVTVNTAGDFRRGVDTAHDIVGSGVHDAQRAEGKRSRKKNKSEAIRAITDISVGDYVVHDNYGIGIFEGVTKLTTDGAKRDYIKLKYAGKDVLYVPVTQLDFIARYIGNTDSANLKLSKLNTESWFKARAKVKKAVEELAQELIALYEKRAKIEGHAFPRDCSLQREFEEAFGYIETDDQLTCIGELKSDMQSSRPMERLLCGDVGFGKTEVALRGAFKCIMDGKQVALLCPTTVLAWQHFQTALQRFASLELPIEIALLSRFRSAKEQREVRAGLLSGKIDFVIGTHALVAKDTQFKDLGLLIIDEEQRFGVMQKERLKETFAGVDTLTLSATPIPRTLNMAMSGIRDMSVIETPPHDRIPVTTYVIEQEY
ncbi:MAG: DEAD/DEAH box helicase, partial [Oscillospiraceae bacterium]|nr:DEAD/DEAH box helicase [Oscillospiraceae bacterium]